MDFIYERTPPDEDGGAGTETTEVRFRADEFEKRTKFETNLPNYLEQFPVREVTAQGVVFDTIVHRRVIHKIIRNEPIKQEPPNGTVTTRVYPQYKESIDASKYL